MLGCADGEGTGSARWVRIVNAQTGVTVAGAVLLVAGATIVAGPVVLIAAGAILLGLGLFVIDDGTN